MTQAIVHGIGLGLMLSVLIGPVFFLLIRTSIERGVKPALILDIGVLVGDVLCIVVAYLGMGTLFENPLYTKILGVIGGIILMGVGLQPFLKKSQSKLKEIELKDKRNYKALAFEGFILNIINPFVIFFWVGSVGYAVTTFDGSGPSIFIYFLFCMITYVIVDLLKIYLAVSIREKLTPKNILVINKIASSGIIILGLVLVIRALQLEGLPN